MPNGEASDDQRPECDDERILLKVGFQATKNYLCVVGSFRDFFMKHTRIARYVDLLFCLVIMPLVITLLPVDRWIVHNTAFLLTLVVYIYGLYFIYRRTRPAHLFLQRKYLRIVLLMLLLVGVTELLTHFPMHESSPALDARQMAARQNMRTQTIWFFFLVVTGFSLAIELTFELFRQMLYKAQINPHFLFNTLNTLYALTLSKSDRAESAFVKFSNILRYMYAQADREMIPLCDEWEYIRQYVDLQQLRLNAHTQVELTETIDNDRVSVPPMLFITFVENAFKYGVSSHLDSRIEIEIKVTEKDILFGIRNRIFEESLMKKGDGIGIANCRKRLALIYPGAHTLDISDSGDFFQVKLRLAAHPEAKENPALAPLLKVQEEDNPIAVITE